MPANAVATGRLILVTCADTGRLDLVLSAAVRRFAPGTAVGIAELVATRAMPAGSGLVVSRNSFARLETASEIVLGWNDRGRAFGYGGILLERLACGENVIAIAPSGCGIEGRARALWRDVRVVHIEPGTETLRAGLSPRACLAREVGGEFGVVGEIVGADVRVRDHGCLATAVRDLTLAIETVLPPVAHAPASVLEQQVPVLRPAGLKNGGPVAVGPRQRANSSGRGAVVRAVRPQVRAISPT